MKMKSHNITIAIGMSGTGKTVLARRSFRDAERAIVCDPQGEFKGGFVVSGRQEACDYIAENDKFRVIFRPVEENDFEFICTVAKRTGNCLFVADELGRYMSPQQIPEPFDDIVSRGRHYNIDIVCNAQRFQQLHKNLTSLTHEYFIFRQFEPADLDETERRCGGRVREIVSELDNLQAVHIVTKEFRAHDPATFSVVSFTVGGGMVEHRVPEFKEV